MTIIFGGRRSPSGDGERFFPLDPTLPEVAAHRPLALAILADYGNPAAHEDRVSAIVDWIARTAIHGHSGLRLPEPYERGLATLPTNTTWADVQGVLSAARQTSDNAFWATFNHDAAAMLNVLLGTLQPDGTRANDGAMELVAADGAQAHYRYRALSTVRSVWCSWQHDVATLLLATIGYPSMLAHITGHDPLRVQYGEQGEWGYWCCTYNEHYAATGETRPIDLAGLRDLTQGGRLHEVEVVKHVGPTWDPLPYVSASYQLDHPEGWPTWATSLDSRIVPNGRTNRLTRSVDDPAVPFSVSSRVSEARASPYLGAYVSAIPVPGIGAETHRVTSSWPGTTELQVRRDSDAWSHLTLGSSGTVRVFAGEQVSVAPVDMNGQRGPAIIIQVPAAE